MTRGEVRTYARSSVVDRPAPLPPPTASVRVTVGVRCIAGLCRARSSFATPDLRVWERDARRSTRLSALMSLRINFSALKIPVDPLPSSATISRCALATASGEASPAHSRSSSCTRAPLSSAGFVDTAFFDARDALLRADIVAISDRRPEPLLVRGGAVGSNSSSMSSSSLVLTKSSSLKLERGVAGVVERERGGTTGGGSDRTSSWSSSELSSSLNAPRISVGNSGWLVYENSVTACRQVTSLDATSPNENTRAV